MEYSVKNYLHPYLFEDIKTISDSNTDWPCLKNKTVFITGGSGFIAFYTVCALLIRNDLYGDNIKVVALVRDESGAQRKYGELLKRADLELVVQDVCDPIEYDKKSDFVIHAASQSSSYYFDNDPNGTIDANLSGTLNCLEYAKKCGAQSTLIVSSLKVYGELFNGKTSICEEDLGYIDIDSHKSCYAQGKRAMETIGCCYARQYGMNVKIARPAYVYGPAGADDSRVWAQFFKNIVRKQNILLKSNGATIRSFCYVTDTVTALLKILLNGKSGVPYNVANPESTVSIRDFAKTAANTFPELGLGITFVNSDDEKQPIISAITATPEVLDASRLLSEGWKPLVGLTEGIKRSVNIMSLRDLQIQQLWLKKIK